MCVCASYSSGKGQVERWRDRSGRDFEMTSRGVKRAGGGAPHEKGASSRVEQTASLLADDGDLEEDDLWDHVDGDVNPFAARAGRESPTVKRR